MKGHVEFWVFVKSQLYLSYTLGLLIHLSFLHVDIKIYFESRLQHVLLFLYFIFNIIFFRICWFVACLPISQQISFKVVGSICSVGLCSYLIWINYDFYGENKNGKINVKLKFARAQCRWTYGVLWFHNFYWFDLCSSLCGLWGIEGGSDMKVSIKWLIFF